MSPREGKQSKKWEYLGYNSMAHVLPKTRSQTPSKIATKVSWETCEVFLSEAFEGLNLRLHDQQKRQPGPRQEERGWEQKQCVAQWCPLSTGI